MTETIYTRNIRSKPDFAGLMNLYDNNYRLLTMLLECLDDAENPILNKDSYTLKICQRRRSRYTQNMDLHYSFHTRRAEREIAIAIVSFKVQRYLDTRQAAVTFSEVELKKPPLMHELLLSLRAKWYYNQCLRVVLKSFLPVKTAK